MMVPVTLIAAVSFVYLSSLCRGGKKTAIAKSMVQASRLVVFCWIISLPYYFFVDFFVHHFLPRYVSTLPLASHSASGSAVSGDHPDSSKQRFQSLRKAAQFSGLFHSCRGGEHVALTGEPPHSGFLIPSGWWQPCRSRRSARGGCSMHSRYVR